MVKHTRRNRKIGGGWSVGPPLSDTAYYVPQYKAVDDCATMARPGAIQFNPDPAKAQIGMAGGSRKITRKQRKQMGGCGCGIKRSLRKRGGSFKMRRYAQRGGCGCGIKQRAGSRNRHRKTRQGTCGYYGAKGGRYVIDTAQSIGGDGPNVAPVFSNFPCEAARPMPMNPISPTALSDAPVPNTFVSGLRPAFIQNGGSTGAPLSLAYAAPRAGFSFTPNIAQGANLNPGQIPYNIVVPQETTGSSSCGASIAAINKM
jgi:hypothetical protein